MTSPRIPTLAWAVVLALPLLLMPLGGYRLDLDVYRTGAQVFLAGGDIYGALPELRIGFGLPFTYPPVAALLFVPLAWVPLEVASLAFSTLSVAALVACAVVVADEMGWRARCCAWPPGRRPVGASRCSP